MGFKESVLRAFGFVVGGYRSRINYKKVKTKVITDISRVQYILYLGFNISRVQVGGFGCRFRVLGGLRLTGFKVRSRVGLEDPKVKVWGFKDAESTLKPQHP